MLSEKIRKYKQSKGKEEGRALYTEILLDIVTQFKNLVNLMRSSIVLHMFLEIENIEKASLLTPVQVKRLFKVGGGLNLLQYHSLVVGRINSKEKIIKMLCNKMLLALRLDLYGEGKFVDLYKEIVEKIEEKEEEIIKIPKGRSTRRGGLKKRIKKHPQFTL